MRAKEKVELDNAIVISSILELVSGVITNIAGNDISNSIDNNPLTKDILQVLITQRITAKIGDTL